MSKKVVTISAVWSIAVLAILAPLWWWAIDGMSPNAVTAWLGTDALLLVIAVSISMIMGMDSI